MLVARACATKNEGDWQKCKRDYGSVHCTIVPGKVPGVPNTGPCGSKPLTISSIYLVALVETRCSPSKTHFEAPTLITFSWPTRHKLRGRSNRLLGGAAGKPGPGQTGALSLRRPPTRSKLGGAPRLRRRPTRNKLRTRGTPCLCRHRRSSCCSSS